MIMANFRFKILSKVKKTHLSQIGQNSTKVYFWIFWMYVSIVIKSIFLFLNKDYLKWITCVSLWLNYGDTNGEVYKTQKY